VSPAHCWPLIVGYYYCVIGRTVDWTDGYWLLDNDNPVNPVDVIEPGQTQYWRILWTLFIDCVVLLWYCYYCIVDPLVCYCWWPSWPRPLKAAQAHCYWLIVDNDPDPFIVGIGDIVIVSWLTQPSYCIDELTLLVGPGRTDSYWTDWFIVDPVTQWYYWTVMTRTDWDDPIYCYCYCGLVVVWRWPSIVIIIELCVVIDPVIIVTIDPVLLIGPNYCVIERLTDPVLSQWPSEPGDETSSQWAIGVIGQIEADSDPDEDWLTDSQPTPGPVIVIDWRTVCIDPDPAQWRGPVKLIIEWLLLWNWLTDQTPFVVDYWYCYYYCGQLLLVWTDPIVSYWTGPVTIYY